MSKELVLKKLDRLAGIYTRGEALAYDIDIMSHPILLEPYDMAALFLDIAKEFSIDLNNLIPDLDLWSLNVIADKISFFSERKK